MWIDINTYQSRQDGTWAYTYRLDGKLHGDVGYPTKDAAHQAALARAKAD